MPLPDWAHPPQPGFEHGNNYSVLEVVWTHPDGDVVIQHRPEPDLITEGPGDSLHRQVDNPHVDRAAYERDHPPSRRRFGRRRARD